MYLGEVFTGISFLLLGSTTQSPDDTTKIYGIGDFTSAPFGKPSKILTSIYPHKYDYERASTPISFSEAVFNTGDLNFVETTSSSSSQEEKDDWWNKVILSSKYPTDFEWTKIPRAFSYAKKRDLTSVRATPSSSTPEKTSIVTGITSFSESTTDSTTPSSSTQEKTSIVTGITSFSESTTESRKTSTQTTNTMHISTTPRPFTTTNVLPTISGNKMINIFLADKIYFIGEKVLF